MHAWQDIHFCYIARKLAFMQEADISLVGPLQILLQGNPIHVVLKRLQSKGTDVTRMHEIAVTLYELGIWDFSRLADEAGRYMIDGNHYLCH